MNKDSEANGRNNSEDNSDSNQRKRLTFEEFCTQSKKIILVPKGADISKYVGFNYLNSLNNREVLVKPMFGLYFPNDLEIKEIYHKFNKDYMDGLEMSDFTPSVNANFSKLFVQKFMDELNVVNFKNDCNTPFEEAQAFLGSANRTGVYLKQDADTLTQLIGKAYIGKAFDNGLVLESDIRIKTLKEFPEAHIVYDFEKTNMWCRGKAV